MNKIVLILKQKKKTKLHNYLLISNNNITFLDPMENLYLNTTLIQS